jgi:hypothetical protein
MPSNLVSQIAYLLAKFPNSNDVYPGSSYAGPTNQAYYGSQVGSRVALGNDDPVIARATSPTLAGGVFQYVQYYVSATAAPKLGLLCFWKTPTTYIVTNDEPTGVSDIAGICLFAVTKGQYGWIQIDGAANVQFRTAITKTTPAIGDLVLAAAAGAGADVATADVLADATSLTSVQARHILGIAVVAPTSGAYSQVRLSFARVNY